MRSGCAARRSDIADMLALRDRLTLFHNDPARMQESAIQPLPVVDDDQPAL